jgi:hypothetical protein
MIGVVAVMFMASPYTNACPLSHPHTARCIMATQADSPGLGANCLRNCAGPVRTGLNTNENRLALARNSRDVRRT